MMFCNIENVQAEGGRAAHLPPPWQEYIITDKGKVFNKHGRELKPQLHNGSVIVHTRLNYKSSAINIAQAVYKAFGDYKIHRKVFHKDGDQWNNAIENLYVIPIEATSKAKAQYEQWAIPSIKKFIRKNNLNYIKGFDVDDFIGEALFVLWKNLSLYREGTKFVSWAWRYIRLAFLWKWKKFKQIIKNEYYGEFILKGDNIYEQSIYDR